MHENLPWIDTKLARELFESQAMGDTAFYNELVATQAAETERMLDELQSALTNGDCTAFRRIAHSFKGSAATFGLTRLQAIARDIEMASIESMPPHAQGLASTLSSAARESLAALREFASTI